MSISAEQHDHARDLLHFIDASPSPWHAAQTIATHLQKSGYLALDEQEEWSLLSGGRYYVLRGGSSVIAFHVGSEVPAESGFRLVGAHTDSPGLRLKPRAAHGNDWLMRLGVDVYGGPILATFTDRDLSLAGRLHSRDENGISSTLIRFDQALVRLPNLAIHMNRKVNEDGLRLNKQSELPMIYGQISADLPPRDRLFEMLGAQGGCHADDIISFELNIYDIQKGCFWGASQEFIADSQIDNLASCHAALRALTAGKTRRHTSVCAFFDHEEVGSQSHQGADGSFLSDVLERLTLGLSGNTIQHKQALARSILLSADAAHAHHPNFPGAYEALHGININAGPAVKVNVNQRYATDAAGEALFMELCRQAGIPGQTYVHHSDLGCGSTIGPMTAARLGVATIDCGPPMWAMHSARESAGVLDQWWFTRLLGQFIDGE